MTTSEIKEWIADAEEAGWTSIDEIVKATITVHGERGNGLSRCQCCNSPVADPCVCDDGGCYLLTAKDGIDTVILCTDCYEKAVEARAKILVHEYEEDGCEFCEEDDSALTDEERELASYLDEADEGRSRQARDLIGGYPRDERRDLHRYQDAIDRERSSRGKSALPQQCATDSEEE